MSEISLLLHQDSIKVEIKKSLRAKRIGIKIRNCGKVELVVPKYSSLSQAQDFLQSKISWIAKHVKRFEKIKTLESDEVMIFGQRHKIKFSNNKEA